MRHVRAIALLLIAAATLLCSPPSLRAQGTLLEAALAGFAEDSFGSTERAVIEIAASGHAMAAEIVKALQDSRLYFNPQTRTVAIKTPDALIDAATGRRLEASEAGAMKPARVNNRVRRAIESAMGTLSLFTANPTERLSAARAVFKSRDLAALPILERAVVAEKDPTVKAALLMAKAALVLSDATSPDVDKLAAIASVRRRGDQEGLALLNSLPATASPRVVEAAGLAAAAVERDLATWSALQNTWYGLSLGSVLLLAAIGLAITFGVMGVINMAHGEMVMLGAYTTFVAQEALRAYAPGLIDLSLVIAVPLAFAVAGTVGIIIERSIIRLLYGRPLETLLATWGLSLILQQAIRTLFGPTNRDVTAPPWMSGAFEVGRLTITYNRLWIILFTLVVFALLLAIFRYTRFGLEMRAVTQNRRMASSMGIRTSRVDALTFGLGSGIAGIAGVALSQIDNVSPNLGQSYIIDSFMVVVFGGVGTLFGTFVGAFSLGIANKFLEPYAGAVLGKIALLVFIILFIQRRPRGLFALKGRAVEA